MNEYKPVSVMFTEGLDTHALRWVREQATDHLHGIRNGSWNLGIPPPEKFRSGHLPRSAVPLSRTVPVEGYSELGSDMDVSSDTEEEIYNCKYSPESSPPQDSLSRRKIPNGTNGVARQHAYYSDGYSDVSSSMDTVRQPVRQKWKQGSMGGYTEEEEEGSSDSSGCTGFVGQTEKRKVVGVAVNEASRGGIAANSYTSHGRFRGNENVSAQERHHTDVPSAPPFHGTQEEISKSVDPVASPSTCDAPCKAGSNVYFTKNHASSKEFEGKKTFNQNIRYSSVGPEAKACSNSLPLKVPTFHACGQGPWYSVIAYDACVRLCLHSWARGCMEAPIFLENECSLLRNSFGLQQILLQSEEELLSKCSSQHAGEGAAVKPKKIIGKMKVQVRRVRMSLDMPSGCNHMLLRTPTVKLESFRNHVSNFQSTLSSGWESLRRVRVLPRLPANCSFSRQSLAYMHASSQYIKQVSALLKTSVNSLRSASTSEVVQESYSCLLRLKSLAEEDKIRMQVGYGETHVFFPDSLGDDLIVEVHDSDGKSLGRVVVQLAIIAEDPNNKVRWWSIYREPEHELVGRIQLYVNYSTTADENGSQKCGSVAETVAYDLVLEVAMKVQHFQQRNLLLRGPWRWLLTEFASYYGVSDAYTRLRYLSYIMDVATPTADCLSLVFDLLEPVVLRNGNKNALSHQENRILGEVEEQIEIILATVFENYKSLDESSPSGIVETFQPSIGTPAAALVPAVNLYKLLHDILSPEAQLKLCSYFQVAAKKISRRLLSETDEFTGSSSGGTSFSANGGTLMDYAAVITAYQKMKNACLNVRNEIFTDIEIHDQHVLPSFVDLKNISASIYSVELCNRLREFLVACPPAGPSAHVADLVIATADFQKDLANWNICPVKGGVDAKELFHLYIVLWIQDKRLSLLESCKLDKVKWSGVRTQHMTTPFVDEMYDLLRDTLKEYEVIICRWPEYTSILENVYVEKAVLEALDRQYADVLTPLKDALTPKKFGLKYVQKLAKRSNISPYTVPEELGVLLNSMKRLLDVLRPKMELQFKSWVSYMPDGGNTSVGEHLSEVTVTLRAKFRTYTQAVVEKLVENTRAQSVTKLKKIIQDSKDIMVESDIRNRMQPLKDQLIGIINHLHTMFEVHVFVSLCRCLWDRMGQDVLNFLEDRKENRSWYKSARITVAVLDDTFASQMQQLLGNALQPKDLEPPRSIMEVRSVLCKDVPSYKDSNSSFYY
ncbi:hypothetical protein AXF42_Ash010803 [Apostasia shenzhenica]|uniref:Pesticidal crystal cry8Ba protein n=1 Tax=Apostasia shenzhenica TaxID=1088818 RepID=A0A2I0A0P6_9ASPA|nr:hypothetical protein AXF42_Ash010803 [Apostasia shenzhenica]